MCKWRMKIHLYGETDSIETSQIKYYKGILQGDMLSLILFIQIVNPLSFILHKEEGYKLGKEKKRGEHRQETEKARTNLSHLFFVDDIKLYARTLEMMRTLLEIVTQFSHDIRMKLGEDKCAYQCIKQGKRSETGEPIKVNNLTFTEIEEGDYKYLRIDESVGYDGSLNTQRVVKEYKRKVNKIRKSELNAINKSIAHNSFAVLITTPTIGILDWTNREIKKLDITTRKILTMNGSFHQSSDINRLYAKRKDGGRGIKSIEDLYECRTIALMEHLEKASDTHSLLNLVKDHERSA